MMKAIRTDPNAFARIEAAIDGLRTEMRQLFQHHETVIKSAEAMDIAAMASSAAAEALAAGQRAMLDGFRPWLERLEAEVERQRERLRSLEGEEQQDQTKGV